MGHCRGVCAILIHGGRVELGNMSITGLDVVN